MNNRIGLRDPVDVTAIVTDPPSPITPITIFVSGEGPDGGEATINGQPQIQITGTTLLEIQGTQMTRENYLFSPFLQLGASWANTIVGESNRFAVSSIAENWSVHFDGADKRRFGYVFLANMDWESDSGSYNDLDACYYVEFLNVIEEQGGMKGMGTGGVNNPIDANPAIFHPAFDEHGTPFENTKVAGLSRLKQLFGIRDDRSNSGWAASPNSGFEILRKFERDPSNPRCWRLIVEKNAAAVTVDIPGVGNLSTNGGSGNIRHVFTDINCDPPPKPHGKDDPQPPVPPILPPGPILPDQECCDKQELSRRVDICIDDAKQAAIECSLEAISEGGWLGVLAGIGYLKCLNDLKKNLKDCDKKAKEDTHCPDNRENPTPTLQIAEK